MSSAILTLDSVDYRFRVRKKGFKFVNFQALEDICLSLHEGETLGVIGDNGAGKSTLLKIIAGILMPTRGKVVHHRELSTSLLSLQIGFSPQLSGVDNAIMGGMLAGYSRREAQSHLEEIIEFSELGERIYDPLKSYSSGMQARLGFAVAMTVGPDILLVDEVLGVGDAAFQAKSMARMQERMISGQTVVFVSHSVPVVRQLCTRAVWLDQGRVHLSGDVEKVLEAYVAKGGGNATNS
ncbi:ABC transporter ATP-binding protein [Pseudodesulfovibrio sediminis]|uniref:ABC transporter domain-containing protein n=1 Tax=Pseudodesulfovibrio sediminis TaxID=2810563 RepID=A0ABN6ERK8_9BACT|nr:ABC transporter ATP-binding protein [Pseudodesulfovibrio sediminis]BCS87978.1 hypothetical protein PSDVSF_12200 [Pseudodesulfovibrio sediminis]